jgi:hypothetical protein
MTQAFNLSQFANTLDVNGKTDLGSGVRNTLPAANGGTGITAPGTAGNVLTSNGSAWVSLAATSGFSGGTINAASATALTLTSASTQVQVVQFTSATNSIVNLPSATTLTAKGAPIYRIINATQCNSPVTIKNATGTILAQIPVAKGADITLTDNSTSAGSWYCDLVDVLPTPSIIDPNSPTQSAISTGFTLIKSSYVMALTDSTYVLCLVGNRQVRTYETPYFGAVAITVSGSSFTIGSVASVEIGNVLTSASADNWGRVEAFRMNSTTAVIHGGLASYWANYTAPSSCCSGGYTYYKSATQSSVVLTVSGTICTLGAVNTNNLPSGINTTNDVQRNEELKSYVYNPVRFPVSGTIFATVGNTSWATNGTMSGEWRYNLSGNLQVTLTSITGTTQTNGTAVSLGANIGAIMGAVSHTANAFIMSYYTCNALNSTSAIRKTVTCANSGTTATWGSPVSLDASVVGVNAPILRQNNNVVLSSTKVVLPYYLIDQYQYRVANISGTVPTVTTTAPLSLIFQPMLVFRSSTEFLVFNEQTTTDYSPATAINTNRTFAKYGVSANDVLYKKTEYAFVADNQNSILYFVAGIPQPTSASTTCIAGVFLSNSQIYLVKGTLPA